MRSLFLAASLLGLAACSNTTDTAPTNDLVVSNDIAAVDNMIADDGMNAGMGGNMAAGAGAVVTVTVNGVDAKSLLKVLALGLDRGAVVAFAATGPQASEAIEAIEVLVRDRFGE